MQSKYNHQVYSAEDKLLVRCLNNIAAIHAECPEGLEEADEDLRAILEFYTENRKYREAQEKEAQNKPKTEVVEYITVARKILS